MLRGLVTVCKDGVREFASAAAPSTSLEALSFKPSAAREVILGIA
jgi:hypothetical protein